MSYPVSFMGMASSSLSGTCGSSIGSLVQNASTPKNKAVYKWEKGIVQANGSDTLTLNLMKAYTNEIFPRVTESNSSSSIYKS